MLGREGRARESYLYTICDLLLDNRILPCRHDGPWARSRLRVDEVGDGPAVQVVFGHALLGEAGHGIGQAGLLRGEQEFRPDVFMVSGVVALVEFVPAAELGADRVPESFITLTRSTASRRSSRGRTGRGRAGSRGIEVLRVRRQVDQRGAEVLHDDLPHPRVAEWSEPAVRHAVVRLRQYGAVDPRSGRARHRVGSAPRTGSARRVPRRAWPARRGSPCPVTATALTSSPAMNSSLTASRVTRGR